MLVRTSENGGSKEYITSVVLNFLDIIVSPSKNRLLEIRLIEKGKARSHFFTSTGEALSFLSSHSFNGSNVYYSVLPRKDRAGNKEAVVDKADVCWVDLDVLSLEECKNLDPEEIWRRCFDVHYQACEKLSEHGITPTVAVFTGHGVQILFKLSREVPKEEIEKLNSILISFLSEFRADNKAKDCARVLRLPGFHNFKDPEKPIKAEIIEFSPTSRVDPELILSLPVERPFESSHTEENSPSLTPPLTSQSHKTSWKRLDRETKEKIITQS